MGFSIDTLHTFTLGENMGEHNGIHAEKCVW